MSRFADRVMEESTTTGTGDITLAGAVTGYRTINASVGQNITFDYAIVAVNGSGVPTGDWEVGEGYLSGSTTLVRALPESGSTTTPINFSAGTKRVFVTLSAASTQDKGNVTAALMRTNWL